MASRTIPLAFLPRSRVPSARRVPRLRRRRPAARLITALLLTVAAVGGGWWWLRDSSVARVTEVWITGLAGRQTPAIRAALTSAAYDMTSLHVRVDALRTAVARYPVIKAVRATGHFPHQLRITVVQRTAVAALRIDGHTLAVAQDGTLLRGVVADGLATITMSAPVAGLRLRDPLAMAQVRIIASAPDALGRRVTRLFTGGRGLQLQLRDGPVVAFGAPRRRAAKWAALTAVLADPASAGATLIDVSVPERPAAVGLDSITPVSVSATPAPESVPPLTP